MSDIPPTSTVAANATVSSRESRTYLGLAVNPQAYLAAIIGSSDDAIISKDLNGIIQSANRAAEQMFGYSAAELIGQDVRILIPPERQSEEDEILSRIR